MNLIELLVVGSYAVAVLAAFILSMYFFREYSSKKLRASLAWAVALLFGMIIYLLDLFTSIVGEAATGKIGVFGGLLLLAFTMTLFYYGTSLLFYGPGSFFREKMAALIFIIYFAISTYLVLTYPLEGFKEAVGKFVQIFLLFPLQVIIGSLFFRVSRRLSSNDPRRKTVFLVSAGWIFLAANSIYRGLFLEPMGVSNAFFTMLLGVAWILILYGMALGKAAKT